MSPKGIIRWLFVGNTDVSFGQLLRTIDEYWTCGIGKRARPSGAFRHAPQRRAMPGHIGRRTVEDIRDLAPHPDDIDQFLSNAKSAQERCDGLAFATIDKSGGGQVAGSTRFMKADLPNKRIEIRFTFLGKTWQRSRINTEAKLLMHTHAFETLGFNRVELLTDYLNTASRRAISWLGAKEEGILRNHLIMPDGMERDSVLFSIVKNEWPGVKQNLEYKLG